MMTGHDRLFFRTNVGTPRVRAAIGACLMLLLVARAESADCVMRAPTAQEQQSYAEAVKAFQRMAPLPPAGWVELTAPIEKILTSVCAPRGQMRSTWSFASEYERRTGLADRQAALNQQAAAINAGAEATGNGNQARLAAIQKRMDAINQKLQSLAAAGKLAEIEPLTQEFTRLGDEQARLQAVDQTNDAADAAGAEAARDTRAGFAVTFGGSNPDTSGFTPYAVPIGKGFRQVEDDGQGNPRATVLVLLPPTAGQRDQTIVRVTGDPARADALLKAAKLP